MHNHDQPPAIRVHLGAGRPHVPPGGPPQGPGPSREIYARMGEDNLRRLCRDFYRRLEASPIRPLFPEDMAAASERIADFLIGLCGGPPLYRERHGEPRLRARHLPFPIDEAARQVWLGAFQATLQDAEAAYGFPAEHLPGFLRWLDEMSAWMINRA